MPDLSTYFQVVDFLLGKLIPLAAFVISLFALKIARKQLEVAQTSNGGKALQLVVRAPTDEELSKCQQVVSDFEVSLGKKFVVTMLTVRVMGPAKFFEVMPCSWGPEGRCTPINTRPIASLTCEDGEQVFSFVLQEDIAKTIKLGVTWSAPHPDGLVESGLRVSSSGVHEQWVPKKPFMIQLQRLLWFRRPVQGGAWKPVKTQ